MLRITYTSGLSWQASEFLCFEHEGYARKKARDLWRMFTAGAEPPGNDEDAYGDTERAWRRRAELRIPGRVQATRNGKYWSITFRDFSVPVGIRKEIA